MPIPPWALYLVEKAIEKGLDWLKSDEARQVFERVRDRAPVTKRRQIEARSRAFQDALPARIAQIAQSMPPQEARTKIGLLFDEFEKDVQIDGVRADKAKEAREDVEKSLTKTLIEPILEAVAMQRRIEAIEVENEMLRSELSRIRPWEYRVYGILALISLIVAAFASMHRS